MDTKQAITRITNMMNIGGQIDDMAALLLATAALQEKQERYNPKPLTLDELREYDAPVYVVNSYNYADWVLHRAGDNAYVDCDGNRWDDDYYGMIGEGSHGLHYLGWLAFRTKPKGDADEI